MSSKVKKSLYGKTIIFSCFGGYIKPKYKYAHYNKYTISNEEAIDNILTNKEFLDFVKNVNYHILYIFPIDKESSKNKEYLQENCGVNGKDRHFLELKSFPVNIIYNEEKNDKL